MKVRVVCYKNGHYETVGNKEFITHNATEYDVLMNYISGIFLEDDIDVIRIVKVKE